MTVFIVRYFLKYHLFEESCFVIRNLHYRYLLMHFVINISTSALLSVADTRLVPLGRAVVRLYLCICHNHQNGNVRSPIQFVFHNESP